MIILTVIGFLSGIISGMGIGGGTLLIPALTIFMGVEQKSAQLINLVYFIPTAIVAVITHAKHGRIEKDMLKPIILSGLLGALAGGALMCMVKADILRKAFGIFLFALGIAEIKKGFKKPSGQTKKSY